MMTAKQTVGTEWLLHLVQAEYLEMPGLQLTAPQVRRLWGLEDETCREILRQLVATGFLRRTVRNLYVLDAPAC